MTISEYTSLLSKFSPIMGFAMLATVLGLAGCDTPTYGTGKSPGIAMIEELAGNVSGSSKNKEKIDYSPRAELVLPPSASLPSPEDKSALSDNPAWPNDPDAARQVHASADQDEIPEEFRQGRLARGSTRAGSTASPIDVTEMTPQQRLEAERKFREQLAATGPGDGTQRRYLTDPPTDYRRPSPNAPQPEEVANSTRPRTLFGSLWRRWSGP